MASDKHQECDESLQEDERQDTRSSDNIPSETSEETLHQDDVDKWTPFKDNSYVRGRQYGTTSTSRDSPTYNMNNQRRGECIILVYEYYRDTEIPARGSAKEDTRLCERAFKKLGFDVKVHKNLKTSQLQAVLIAASNRDHRNCDAFVLVFMSHGDSIGATEYVHTYDGKLLTSCLWEPFVNTECTSLAGKPKLFFIQACRGKKIDRGVGLAVMTDSSSVQSTTKENYVIPVHADTLVMWASYSGMFAFKSSNNGMNGSVFIHFLTKAFEEDGDKTDLFDILLKVTRNVALDYESNCPGQLTHANKQVPQIMSTLLRKIYFDFPEKSSK